MVANQRKILVTGATGQQGGSLARLLLQKEHKVYALTRNTLSLFMNTRNRTSSKYIGYGLYSYFADLSLRKTSERLSSCFIKRNHVSVWNWI
jgi:GDP-D-mannose dehydratase